MRKVYVLTGTYKANERYTTFIAGVYSSQKKAAKRQYQMICKDPDTIWKIITEVLL